MMKDEAIQEIEKLLIMLKSGEWELEILSHEQELYGSPPHYYTLEIVYSKPPR